jgi:molybdopterin synthase sulfur carrier subunit
MRPVKLLYFAWLRERVGVSEEDIILPADIGSIGELIPWLRQRSPGHAAAFVSTASLRCAVNQDFAAPDTLIVAGDEIAFFPPVTGG